MVTSVPIVAAPGTAGYVPTAAEMAQAQAAAAAAAATNQAWKTNTLPVLPQMGSPAPGSSNDLIRIYDTSGLSDPRNQAGVARDVTPQEYYQLYGRTPEQSEREKYQSFNAPIDYGAMANLTLSQIASRYGSGTADRVQDYYAAHPSAAAQAITAQYGAQSNRVVGSSGNVMYQGPVSQSNPFASNTAAGIAWEVSRTGGATDYRLNTIAIGQSTRAGIDPSFITYATNEYINRPQFADTYQVSKNTGMTVQQKAWSPDPIRQNVTLGEMSAGNFYGSLDLGVHTAPGDWGGIYVPDATKTGPSATAPLTIRGEKIVAGLSNTGYEVVGNPYQIKNALSTYVPYGSYTQEQLDNTKLAIDKRTGEVAIYQYNENLKQWGLIGGGGRNSLQSGMFSVGQAMTPYVTSQTGVGTYQRPSGEGQSRLGAEAYGGFVRPYNPEFLLAPNEAVSRYYGAGGKINLANFVDQVAAGKSEAPGAHIHYTLADGSAAPGIQYMNEKGLTGEALSPMLYTQSTGKVSVYSTTGKETTTYPVGAAAPVTDPTMAVIGAAIGFAAGFASPSPGAVPVHGAVPAAAVAGAAGLSAPAPDAFETTRGNQFKLAYLPGGGVGTYLTSPSSPFAGFGTVGAMLINKATGDVSFSTDTFPGRAMSYASGGVYKTIDSITGMFMLPSSAPAGMRIAGTGKSESAVTAIPARETTTMTGGNQTITALGGWIDANRPYVQTEEQANYFNQQVGIFNEMSKQNPIVTKTVTTGGSSTTTTSISGKEYQYGMWDVYAEKSGDVVRGFIGSITGKPYTAEQARMHTQQVVSENPSTLTFLDTVAGAAAPPLTGLLYRDKVVPTGRVVTAGVGEFISTNPLDVLPALAAGATMFAGGEIAGSIIGVAARGTGATGTAARALQSPLATAAVPVGFGVIGAWQLTEGFTKTASETWANVGRSAVPGVAMLWGAAAPGMAAGLSAARSTSTGTGGPSGAGGPGGWGSDYVNQPRPGGGSPNFIDLGHPVSPRDYALTSKLAEGELTLEQFNNIMAGKNPGAGSPSGYPSRPAYQGYPTGMSSSGYYLTGEVQPGYIPTAKVSKPVDYTRMMSDIVTERVNAPMTQGQLVRQQRLETAKTGYIQQITKPAAQQTVVTPIKSGALEFWGTSSPLTEADIVAKIDRASQQGIYSVTTSASPSLLNPQFEMLKTIGNRYGYDIGTPVYPTKFAEVSPYVTVSKPYASMFAKTVSPQAAVSTALVPVTERLALPSSTTQLNFDLVGRQYIPVQTTAIPLRGSPQYQMLPAAGETAGLWNRPVDFVNNINWQKFKELPRSEKVKEYKNLVGKDLGLSPEDWSSFAQEKGSKLSLSDYRTLQAQWAMDEGNYMEHAMVVVNRGNYEGVIAGFNDGNIPKGHKTSVHTWSITRDAPDVLRELYGSERMKAPVASIHSHPPWKHSPSDTRSGAEASPLMPSHGDWAAYAMEYNYIKKDKLINVEKNIISGRAAEGRPILVKFDYPERFKTEDPAVVATGIKRVTTLTRKTLKGSDITGNAAAVSNAFVYQVSPKYNLNAQYVVYDLDRPVEVHHPIAPEDLFDIESFVNAHPGEYGSHPANQYMPDSRREVYPSPTTRWDAGGWMIGTRENPTDALNLRGNIYHPGRTHMLNLPKGGIDYTNTQRIQLKPQPSAVRQVSSMTGLGQEVPGAYTDITGRGAYGQAVSGAAEKQYVVSRPVPRAMDETYGQRVPGAMSDETAVALGAYVPGKVHALDMSDMTGTKPGLARWNPQRTDIPIFDSYISGEETISHSGYEIRKTLNWMSPDEYIKTQKTIMAMRPIAGGEFVATLPITEAHRVGDVRFERGISKSKLEAVKEAMRNPKNEFASLAIERDISGRLKDYQEGRHRAVAAKELGYEKIPVWEFQDVPRRSKALEEFTGKSQMLQLRTPSTPDEIDAILNRPREYAAPRKLTQIEAAQYIAERYFRNKPNKVGDLAPMRDYVGWTEAPGKTQLIFKGRAEGISPEADALQLKTMKDVAEEMRLNPGGNEPFVFFRRSTGETLYKGYGESPSKISGRRIDAAFESLPFDVQTSGDIAMYHGHPMGKGMAGYDLTLLNKESRNYMMMKSYPSEADLMAFGEHDYAINRARFAEEGVISPLGATAFRGMARPDYPTANYRGIEKFDAVRATGSTGDFGKFRHKIAGQGLDSQVIDFGIGAPESRETYLSRAADFPGNFFGGVPKKYAPVPKEYRQSHISEDVYKHMHAETDVERIQRILREDQAGGRFEDRPMYAEEQRMLEKNRLKYAEPPKPLNIRTEAEVKAVVRTQAPAGTGSVGLTLDQARAYLREHYPKQGRPEVYLAGRRTPVINKIPGTDNWVVTEPIGGGIVSEGMTLSVKGKPQRFGSLYYETAVRPQMVGHYERLYGRPLAEVDAYKNASPYERRMMRERERESIADAERAYRSPTSGGGSPTGNVFSGLGSRGKGGKMDFDFAVSSGMGSGNQMLMMKSGVEMMGPSSVNKRARLEALQAEEEYLSSLDSIRPERQSASSRREELAYGFQPGSLAEPRIERALSQKEATRRAVAESTRNRQGIDTIVERMTKFGEVAIATKVAPMSVRAAAPVTDVSIRTETFLRTLTGTDARLDTRTRQRTDVATRTRSDSRVDIAAITGIETGQKTGTKTSTGTKQDQQTKYGFDFPQKPLIDVPKVPPLGGGGGGGSGGGGGGGLGAFLFTERMGIKTAREVLFGKEKKQGKVNKGKRR